MKIRLGFVTNSSSSSYIVIGYNMTEEEVIATNGTIHGHQIIAIGDCLYDGMDVIRLNSGLIEAIAGYEPQGEFNDGFSFFEVVQFCGDYDDVNTIWLANQTADRPNVSIQIINQDDHSTETLEEFRERYLD